MPSEITYVDKFPQCNFCPVEAHYDARTTAGPWAYMCEAHFKQYGVGLGVGRGQKLELRSGLRQCVINTVGEKPSQGDFKTAVTKCAEKPLAVTMTMEQLEESVMDSVWYPTCPYCGAETGAEPDASAVYCDNCGKRFRIINPFF